MLQKTDISSLFIELMLLNKKTTTQPTNTTEIDSTKTQTEHADRILTW